ncbi:MAG: hypothetical protein IJ419_03085 [Agathobacter sp.]|nr:hypothetical protein [Agathobacter sp.]
MFPFLTIFIIFLIILTYYIKKGNAAQSKVQEEFWEKERKSNAVRKQDISKLDYITIPLEKIPQQLHTATEEAFWALAQKTMVNLTGISNTDLKLQYGTANLAVLSEYDANFTEMVSLLPEYTTELIEAGQETAARDLLEFAVSCNADSRKIYSQLASIYKSHNEVDKLKKLMEASEALPELTKRAVQKELSEFTEG